MANVTMESVEVTESSPANTTSQNGQMQESQQSKESKPVAHGLQRKQKGRAKKNSMAVVKLSNLVTSTNKIQECCDQIVIGHDKSFGLVRTLFDYRVQRRYDALKATLPVDFILWDLLFYKVTGVTGCVLE